MIKTSIYPLHDLDSEAIPPIQIEDGVNIIKNTIDIDKVNKNNVSTQDAHYIRNTQLCLQIEEDIVSPEEASVDFIISCRLLKRTKVFVRYRIDSSNLLCKVRDDYSFVTSSSVTSTIKHKEFKKVARLYTGLKQFKNINTRTNNAVYFLVMAYRSRSWLESLLFHVCVLETLTSGNIYEDRVTQKFIQRVHNFTGYNENKLRKIYNIRSELVHGRYNNKSKEEHLIRNRIAEAACRKALSKILLKPNYLDSFKEDTLRIELFEDN